MVVPGPDCKVILVLMGYGSATGLQCGHLVLALREVVFRMAQRQPGFYILNAYPRLQHERIGQIMFTAATGSALANNVPNVTAIQSPGPSGSLAADSGEMIDPGDPRFKVRWNYEGLDIPSQEVFTAIVDTQTIAVSQT